MADLTEDLANCDPAALLQNEMKARGSALALEPLAELADQLRAGRVPVLRKLPSPQNGVFYLKKQNVFLCNGMDSVHPADMVDGFYYPLTSSQIKALRKAAALAEPGRRGRYTGRGDYYRSESYARDCFFNSMHRGREARRAASRGESVSYNKREAVEGFADAATCRISHHSKRRYSWPV